MPDNITWSVKVNEETQERLRGLVEESGFNNREFFVNLLSMYEIQRAKEITPILTADIEELETLTRRINSIFANASERINTLQREANKENEKQAETNQSTIELLQQRIDGMKQDSLHDEERIHLFIQDKETAESKTDELLQQAKQLENTISDKTALIEEYKRKNDDLSGIVSEYKTAATESKKLSDTVNNLKQVNNEKQRQIEELKRELQQQADTFKVEQENMKKSFLIDKDTALLELKKEQQKDLQEQQTEYSHKINEYEATVRSLLEQIQDNKTAPKTTSGTSRKTSTSKNKKDTTATEQ